MPTPTALAEIRLLVPASGTPPFASVVGYSQPMPVDDAATVETPDQACDRIARLANWRGMSDHMATHFARVRVTADEYARLVLV